mmetsp:Transcript_10035/g.29548  ORF Transcript_10035/g.29548 Transcript_10035/m.29548 type:complete len:103 (-) Transcript_10035:292-600(-)
MQLSPLSRRCVRLPRSVPFRCAALEQVKTTVAEGIAKGADIVAGGAQTVKEKMVGEEKEEKTLGDKAAEAKQTAASKVEEGKDAAATRIAEGADAVKSAVNK